MTQRLKARFGDAFREASLDRKQAIVTIALEQLREISRYCRDEEKFDMLVDLTAVDWPKREKRFDVVLNLYSFAKNERLRLKAHAGRERAGAERLRNLACGELDGARMLRHVRDCV